VAAGGQTYDWPPEQIEPSLHCEHHIFDAEVELHLADQLLLPLESDPLRLTQSGHSRQAGIQHLDSGASLWRGRAEFGGDSIRCDQTPALATGVSSFTKARSTGDLVPNARTNGQFGIASISIEEGTPCCVRGEHGVNPGATNDDA
jgi:hypothetical protein